MKKIKLLTSLVGIAGLSMGLVPVITLSSCNKGNTPTPTPTPVKSVLVEGVEYETVRANECLVKATAKGLTKSGTITIPEKITINGVEKTITGIADYGFTNTTSKTGAKATSIVFANANNITSIGYGAFQYCKNLTSFDVPANVPSISATAFVSSGLKTVNISGYVCEIGAGAFYDCQSLKTVTFADDSRLATIKNLVFGNCTSLSEITIPEATSTIESYAFFQSSSLSSVTFKNTDQWKRNDTKAIIDVTKPADNAKNLIDLSAWGSINIKSSKRTYYCNFNPVEGYFTQYTGDQYDIEDGDEIQIKIPFTGSTKKNSTTLCKKLEFIRLQDTEGVERGQASWKGIGPQSGTEVTLESNISTHHPTYELSDSTSTWGTNFIIYKDSNKVEPFEFEDNEVLTFKFKADIASLGRSTTGSAAFKLEPYGVELKGDSTAWNFEYAVPSGGTLPAGKYEYTVDLETADITYTVCFYEKGGGQGIDTTKLEILNVIADGALFDNSKFYIGSYLIQCYDPYIFANKLSFQFKINDDLANKIAAISCTW